jgi:membrane protein YdbS with pleckstrin-like domain
MAGPESPMKEKTYRSKIDTWLLGVFAVSALMAVGACLPALRNEGLAVLFVAVPTLAVGLGLPSWLIASTSYTLTDDELLVRSGPFRWVVPFQKITSVTLTRNPLSSPALSLDRLRIEYAGRWIMISPHDRGAFVEELRERGVKI